MIKRIFTNRFQATSMTQRRVENTLHTLVHFRLCRLRVKLNVLFLVYYQRFSSGNGIIEKMKITHHLAFIIVFLVTSGFRAFSVTNSKGVLWEYIRILNLGWIWYFRRKTGSKLWDLVSITFIFERYRKITISDDFRIWTV